MNGLDWSIDMFERHVWNKYEERKGKQSPTIQNMCRDRCKVEDSIKETAPLKNRILDWNSQGRWKMNRKMKKPRRTIWVHAELSETFKRSKTAEHLLLDGRTVENKGKLILTEIFPSVQKHDI